ncbi:hypothetical protein BH24PSE2_BH24PSE2_05490 [soil metagenome]
MTMYTRCPHCDTKFHIGSEQLAAADGRVRCGRCHALFDAVALWSKTDHGRGRGLSHSDGGQAVAPRPPAARDGKAARRKAVQTVAPSMLVEEPDDQEIELYFGSTYPGALHQALAETSTELPSEMPVAEIEADSLGQNFRDHRLAAPHSRLFWGIACLAALGAVAAQLLYLDREAWTALPGAEDVIERVYRIVGRAPPPQWELNDYRVVTAAAAAEASGTLRVSATLKNEAPHPQPYPILRMILTDRWGDGIGTRWVEPSDYVAEDLDSDAVLEPGELVSASIALGDPGQSAFGFELAVCLRDAQLGVRCTDSD